MPTGRPKALPPPGQPIRLIEHPIAAHFFAWDRQESRRPLIVAGTSADDPLGAAQFAQMAVSVLENSRLLNEVLAGDQRLAWASSSWQATGSGRA